MVTNVAWVLEKLYLKTDSAGPVTIQHPKHKLKTQWKILENSFENENSKGKTHRTMQRN